MKILYVCLDAGIPYWGTKGASIHIREFTNAMKAAEHEVRIEIARLGTEHPADGVREIPSIEADFFHAGQDTGSPGMLREAKSFARNFSAWTPPAREFDLVYERYSLFGVAGLALARQRGIPFVLEVNAPLLAEQKTYRILVMEPLARSIEQYLFSNADLIIAVSQGAKDYILRVASEARVTVLPNGVDVAPYSRAQRNKGMQESLGGGNFLVGFVGSMKPWHGVDLLLQAFSELPADEGDRLVFVGEGPMADSIREASDQLGLHSRVTLTGAIGHEAIPETLMALEVLVAPYPATVDFYFSPIKIFEYMASGRPIIASGIGQVAEILEHEKTALLVPPGDTVALTEALLRLKSDPELGACLAQAAKQEVRSAHTWAARFQTIEPCFAKLIWRSSRRDVASSPEGAAR